MDSATSSRTAPVERLPPSPTRSRRTSSGSATMCPGSASEIARTPVGVRPARPSVAKRGQRVQNVDLLRGSRRISTDLRRTVELLGPQSYPSARTFAAAAPTAVGRRVTSGERGDVLDDLTITLYRRGTALAEIDAIAPIYASAYAEAPYYERPDDVIEFRTGWPRRVAQPCVPTCGRPPPRRARAILLRPPAHHQHAVVGRVARRRRRRRAHRMPGPHVRRHRTGCERARCAASALRANSTLISWPA